ncbi:MAG TPA: hypothetical protein QGF95_04000 [Candidatus Latescibacteria bacterium]|jgi:hypothetical protein|nr:hypothetical protein [Gemmatimonadaceae bacterium]MDP6015742.1 hypothetical protein [Candidatus Latescibacterota bacterium]HJP29699.1 hypothetical protein [Candidatus Latescibacterota bacterium]
MTDTEYHRQVDARARQLLQACYDRGGHRSLWSFHAALACDGDPEELMEIVAREHEPGPFNIIPGIHLLCRWEDRLPTAASEHIKSMFFDCLQQRGNTENHWLMVYAGNLLAAERWADEPLFWNGLPPAAMHAEASRWILGTIARMATVGHYEYDSTGYHNEHFIPYLALAEHGRDPLVRQQAGKAVLLLLTDMALEYFHGAYAGGHGREGNVNTWTQVGPGQGLNYLYFGDEEFEPERHCQTYATPAAAAAFRPPALLARLALGRDTPHAVRKTKPPRAAYRHVDQGPEAVRKYTWISRSFALGSTQTGLVEAPVAPIDLTSWDLTWRGARHQAKICSNHPYRSSLRFSSFLPELPQRVGRSVGTRKPYLQVPDRLFGASPYERMMQHEGTIVVLYRIPADDDAPYVNCFLPRGATWCEQRGWIMSDQGDFYVGVRPIGPYRWEDIHEPGKDGNWIDGWLLRIDDLNAGLVLEAVEKDQAGSFDDFCRVRSGAHLDLTGWPEAGHVSVDSCAGTRLDMVYGGWHRVDGKDLNYEAYPLFGAPGVDAPLGTGKVTLCNGEETLALDFDIDPTVEPVPMRVIG